MKNKYNYNKKELLFYAIFLFLYIGYKVRKIVSSFIIYILYINFNSII